MGFSVLFCFFLVSFRLLSIFFPFSSFSCRFLLFVPFLSAFFCFFPFASVSYFRVPIFVLFSASLVLVFFHFSGRKNRYRICKSFQTISELVRFFQATDPLYSCGRLDLPVSYWTPQHRPQRTLAPDMTWMYVFRGGQIVDNRFFKVSRPNTLWPLLLYRNQRKK